MFSPPVTLPVRSSPSRKIHGAEFSEPKAFPIAWTTPLRPSASSYRQPKSRSMPLDTVTAVAAAFILARNPPEAGGGAGGVTADQFRLTFAIPPDPPPLVSDTFGAPLVNTT